MGVFSSYWLGLISHHMNCHHEQGSHKSQSFLWPKTILYYFSPMLFKITNATRWIVFLFVTAELAASILWKTGGWDSESPMLCSHDDLLWLNGHPSNHVMVQDEKIWAAQASRERCRCLCFLFRCRTDASAAKTRKWRGMLETSTLMASHLITRSRGLRDMDDKLRTLRSFVIYQYFLLTSSCKFDILDICSYV